MTRIMTLNIHAYGEGHGSWRERRPLIVAAIREARPDVIALQAVARDPSLEGGVDQASQLARELTGYDVCYQTAHHHPQGREDGLAFLSRRPALAIQTIRLSRCDGGEDPFQRIIMRGRFAAPGGELQVFNAHFSWVKAQADDNVREALPHLYAATGAELLIGDFNQTPDSEALAALRKAGLIDAWSTLHANAPGFSFYEQGALARRIDFALLNAVAARRLLAARLVLDEPGPRRASDHAALVVDLHDDPA